MRNGRSGIGAREAVALLSCESFAESIIRSGDLDPDYIFIRNVADALSFDRAAVGRWIVLKSVVYDSASELEILLRDAPLESVSFGAERRKAKPRAAEFLAAIRSATDDGAALDRLPTAAADALRSLRAIHGVGAWAAWKLLDLSERVLGIPFDFSRVDFRSAYQFPLRGILMLAGRAEDPSALRDDGEYRAVLATAIERIGTARALAAPPRRERACGIQEFETVFCKYHSYVHGRYRPDQDREHLRARLRASRHAEIRALERLAP